MTDKHIITDGCEFQSDCIEYKDISYLKIMPICAIHELSIACHDKVNKCKYYKLYKQLKAKEQECEELKEDRERWKSNFNGKVSAIEELLQQLDQLKTENEELKEEIKHYKQIAQYHGNLSVKYTNKSAKLKQTLTEIKEFAEKQVKRAPDGETFSRPEIKQILQKISECEVNND